MKIAVVIGTRPEAIKLAPVIRALEALPGIRVQIVSTGQHREMLRQVLDIFAVEPDHDLALMTANQSLAHLSARLLTALDAVFAADKPAAVLVQGDTTTAFAASLAAFYHQIPVGHVEAGLRTNDRYAPFPEEINRHLVSALAHWHFAPTETSRAALLREGIDDEAIVVTGNTVIDALHFTLATTAPPPLLHDHTGRRLVLVTAHRRESFGESFDALCRAIRTVADRHADVEIWYPVHLNPRVREPVGRILANHPRIRLLEPLDYVSFVHLLARAHLVLTDSGGLQEEAPALGKPVLVMREVTERPEAVAAGVAELVGTDEERIAARASHLLDDEAAYARMARAVSPYGDGVAGSRIAAFVGRALGGAIEALESFRGWAGDDDLRQIA